MLCSPKPAKPESLSHLGYAREPTKRAEGSEAVADAIADMKKNGEPIPEPVTSKHYSGKFIVRVPPEVHRRLALEAAESGVSLNRLASARLSH